MIGLNLNIMTLENLRTLARAYENPDIQVTAQDWRELAESLEALQDYDTAMSCEARAVNLEDDEEVNRE
jgi:hypothetical protein